MGASSLSPVKVQPARLRGPVGVWAMFMLVCALGAPAAHAAAANAHAEALAALADTRAAIAEIVRAEDLIVNSPNPYHRAAHRAVNAITGAGDRYFDPASGNPGDAAGALGHIDHALDRRGNPPWVNTLHGVQVNLRAAVARLEDSLEAREMEDYQFKVTDALLNLEAAVGHATKPGVFGGLTGALATTSLGVPRGAHRVSACGSATSAPAYGVKDGYLAFIAVPAARGTAGLPENFGSRDIHVAGDILVVQTAVAGLVDKLCSKATATPKTPAEPPPHAQAAGTDPPLALYTRAQAAAGRHVFAEHCKQCHGANLQGTSAPAVAGPGFLKPAEHNGWTLETVRYLVVNNMPFNNPGSLTPEQYANVLAFLLSANCFPPGATPFPQHPDPRLKNIALHPISGVRPTNPKFSTCESLP